MRRFTLLGSFLILYTLLLNASSCALLNNSKVKKVEESYSDQYVAGFTLSNQKNWSGNSESLLLYKDSSQQNYAVQLWPKGVFTYSDAYGFTGEADSVKILRSTRNGISGSSAATQHKEGGITENQQFHENQTIKADINQKQKEKSPSLKIVLFVVLCGCVIAGWFYFRK